MSEQEKHDKCPFCGESGYSLVSWDCGTLFGSYDFIQKSGRGVICYQREIEQTKAQLQAVMAERDEYKPYYDALRARHNGYDEEAVKQFPELKPASPQEALDGLLQEADEFAQDAPIYKVLIRLKSRNATLERRMNDILGHINERGCVSDDHLFQCIEADAKEAIAAQALEDKS